MMRQLLQHLRHEGYGNTILLGDFIRAASVLLAMHRQVLHGDQPIVGFFRELKHRIRVSQSYEAMRNIRLIQSHLYSNPKLPSKSTQNSRLSKIKPVFRMLYSKTVLVLFATHLRPMALYCIVWRKISYEW